MIDRVRKSFYEGVKQFKMFASFLSERTKVETSMAKQFYESSRLEARLDGLYNDIGRRVVELDEKGEKAISRDFVIREAIDEAKKLKRQIEECKKGSMS